MFLSEVAPPGTDAAAYQLIGQRCATIGACWDPVRPAGAVLYFSLPYRLGLPPETIVVLNWALLALSVTLAGRLLAALLPSRVRGRAAWATGISAASHVTFMGAPACNALSDVPAACLLLVGIELAVLGWQTASRWLLPAAGLSMSLAAFVRAYYLFPVLLGVGVAVVVGALRHRASRALALVTLAWLPIAGQVISTYVETATISYLDPVKSRPWSTLHLEAPWFGYDTLVPAQPLLYIMPAGQWQSGGLIPLLRAGNVTGLARLLARRVNFTYGSWVPFGGVYLRAAAERTFSAWILVAHVLAAALVLWRLARSRRSERLVLPVVVLGAVVVEGLAIIPEARFVMAAQAALWTAAIATAVELAGRAVDAWRTPRAAQV